MTSMFSTNSTDSSVLDALHKPNVLVADVRSPEEYKSGNAFQGAVNVPVDSVDQMMSQFGNDKNRPIITYCVEGKRAAQAAELISAHGFSNVMSTTNADHLREITKTTRGA